MATNLGAFNWQCENKLVAAKAPTLRHSIFTSTSPTIPICSLDVAASNNFTSRAPESTRPIDRMCVKSKVAHFHKNRLYHLQIHSALHAIGDKVYPSFNINAITMHCKTSFE